MSARFFPAPDVYCDGDLVDLLKSMQASCKMDGSVFMVHFRSFVGLFHNANISTLQQSISGCKIFSQASSLAHTHPMATSNHFPATNSCSCFFSFQLQAQLQSGEPQPDLDTTNNGHEQTNGGGDDEDDIDAALNDLQVSLEGSSVSTHGDITHIPELQDYLKFFK